MKLISTLTAVFIFSWFLQACGQKPRSANSDERIEENGVVLYASDTTSHSDPAYTHFYDAAIKLVVKNQFKEAIEVYRNLMQRDTGKCGPYDGLGACYNNIEVHDSAIFYYQKALALNPRCMASLIGLGSSLDAVGKVSAATAIYNQALSIDPRNADAHWGLAVIYYDKGDKEKAKLHAKKFIEIAPASENRVHLEYILNN